MELENLMSAFAEKLGIEGVEVKDGTCSLTIDDIPMEFTESPRANTQLYGTQGIALGISPDTGEIILIGGLPFKGLEMEEFCKDLDEFVSKAEEWRETVENFRPAAEEAAVRDEEASRLSKFGGNGPGFMSV